MSPSDRAALERTNADLRHRVANLEARVAAARRPLESRDLNELEQIKARADAVAAKFGKPAPAPMPGERPEAFRVRVLHDLQRHSPEFSDFDLARADHAMLEVAEREIFKAAERVAESGTETSAPLVEVEEVDAFGRRVTKRYGDFLAAYGSFMAPGAVCRVSRPGFSS